MAMWKARIESSYRLVRVVYGQLVCYAGMHVAVTARQVWIALVRAAAAALLEDIRCQCVVGRLCNIAWLCKIWTGVPRADSNMWTGYLGVNNNMWMWYRGGGDVCNVGAGGQGHAMFGQQLSCVLVAWSAACTS